MEMLGFWIMLAGELMVATLLLPARALDWAEKRLHAPWWAQALMPALGAILIMIGLQMCFVASHGRWSGYPFDKIIKW